MTGKLRIVRIESPLGGSESVSCVPDPRLQSFVEGDYRGYVELDARPVVMRETPSPIIPMIFNLGPPWRISNAVAAPRREDSFLAGLDEHYTLVESAGASSCMQVDFTPLGALRVLRRPLSEIANQVVSLPDIFGPGANILIDRMREADWAQRIALLEEFLLHHFTETETVPGELSWAWMRLRKRHGQIPIARLADETGWSHKRLIAGFRQQFGLTPRRAGRVMRFGRATRLLRGAPTPRWAELAADCGYYDQAHLDRDFRAFAGVTPGEFIAGLLPVQRLP
ncbi:MAG TPA: AraC family transcriptional regulator [Rhizomicrobium sp.]|jgi:AraC-like DNA-binding protein